MSATLAPAQETILKASRVLHLLVLKEVYLNGQGPFRMMIDTGAASCAAGPVVARELGLKGAYVVEHETVAGVSRVAASILDEVRIGSVSDRGIEFLLTEVRLPGVDGVLGQSWLVRHDYLLDYRNRQVVLDPKAPERGVRAALRSSDGRPAIAAEVNGNRQDLVVDSGASALILFAPSRRAGQQATLLAQSGSVEALAGSAKVTIGPGYSRTMLMSQVNSSPRPGLLPAAAFASVYVSNRNGVVVLLP